MKYIILIPSLCLLLTINAYSQTKDTTIVINDTIPTISNEADSIRNQSNGNDTTIVINDSIIGSSNEADSIKYYSKENDTTFFIPNNAFMSGEKLKYAVKYGLIKGGEATLSVRLVQHGYSYVYHAVAQAVTSGVAKKFYTVEDTYESYFDVETGLPIMAIRDIHEQNYKRYNELRFDRDKKIVMSLKSGNHKVPVNILDILSSYYFARTYLFKGLKKNQIIKMSTFFDDELFILEIKYKGIDKIRTKYGKVKCLKFVPVTKKGGTFEKEKDLVIWFTDDGNFIPVKIELNLPLSAAKMELINYKGIKNPFGGLQKK